MANVTLYYSALDDFVKDAHAEAAQHETTKENNTADTQSSVQYPSAELLETPKRTVPIRKHNLFAKESSFVIRRRMPPASLSQLSPGEQEFRRELQRIECLRLRQERVELNKKAQPQRLTLRI